MNWSLLRSSCLVLSGCLLAGCDPKDKPKPHAESSKANAPKQEAAKPEAPKPAAAVHHAPRYAARLAAIRQIPAWKDTGPLSWPVVVMTDKDGHAVPPKTSSTTKRHGTEERTAMLPFEKELHALRESFRPPGHYIKGGKNGFYDSNGNFWQAVNAPPLSGKSAGGNNASGSRDGSRSDYDSSSGNDVRHNADGSTDYHSDDGSTIHVNGPGGGSDGLLYSKNNPDGSVDAHSKDGTTDHYSPDGKGDYTDWPNGKRTRDNDDGTQTIIDPDGGSHTPGAKNGDPGVDIPPPKSVPPPDKPPGDKPAGGNGEPHYLTRDGTEITTQAAGEFVLVTGVPGHEVQARQQPYSDKMTASAITSLAFRVGDAKVEVRSDNKVMINGQEAVEGAFVQGNIPGGGAVGVWRDGGRVIDVLVIWPDLSMAWINHSWSFLNFVLQWKDKAPDHRGILGSNDDNPANDLTDRSGKLCASDAAGIAAFVESWRVTDAESLFTYNPGESTATFTLKDFPHPAPAPDQKAALAAASVLPDGPLREMCAYDIAMTGDTRFVDAYQTYAGLRGAVEANTKTTTANAAASQPETQSVLFITEDERKNAKPAESNGTIKETLTANQSAVYKLQLTEEADHGVMSHKLQVREEYKPGMPGYAYFDDQGKPMGKAYPAWNDCPAIKFRPGTYYLKLVGPGDIDIVTDDYGK